MHYLSVEKQNLKYCESDTVRHKILLFFGAVLPVYTDAFLL